MICWNDTYLIILVHIVDVVIGKLDKEIYTRIYFSFVVEQQHILYLHTHLTLDIT